MVRGCMLETFVVSDSLYSAREGELTIIRVGIAITILMICHVWRLVTVGRGTFRWVIIVEG